MARNNVAIRKHKQNVAPTISHGYSENSMRAGTQRKRKPTLYTSLPILYETKRVPCSTLTDCEMSDDCDVFKNTEMKFGTTLWSRRATITTDRFEPLGHSMPSINASGSPPAVSNWPDWIWSELRTFHHACCREEKKPCVSWMCSPLPSTETGSDGFKRFSAGWSSTVPSTR